jgi:hypothetical protein
MPFATTTAEQALQLGKTAAVVEVKREGPGQLPTLAGTR